MKGERQKRIREIILETAVDTQEQLLQLLSNEGFKVTQATVSRDMRDLRLVKITGADGRYRYALPKTESALPSSKFERLFADHVISVDFAMNLVVVKCVPGMAQAVCAAMDTKPHPAVVGTLAGEDTFVCITKDIAQAQALTAELNRVKGRG